MNAPATPAAAEAIDAASLSALIDAAALAGAEAALERIGLTDAAAGEDLRELRQLLGAWRDAKRSVWKAVIDWAVRGLLALLLVGIAVRLGLSDLLR